MRYTPSKFELALAQAWYSIPRPWIRVNFGLKKPDGRSVQWYRDRAVLGFDERELWNLSIDLDARIRKSMGFAPDDDKYINFWAFYDWIRDPKSKDDLVWFERRVSYYVSSNCPFQAKRSEPLDGGDDWEDHYMTRDECDGILLRYLELLGDAIRGNVTEELARFLYDHNRFGW